MEHVQEVAIDQNGALDASFVAVGERGGRARLWAEGGERGVGRGALWGAVGAVVGGVIALNAAGDSPVGSDVLEPAASLSDIRHRTVEIQGLDIFFREAGDPSNPTVLLLHGFPTSSHMFRELIPRLADFYHVVAPDFPGYGESSMPLHTEFDYTFANLASVTAELTEYLELDSYSIYLMDYGAPVGFRLASSSPEKVDALIVQNGNAYVEGIDNAFWAPIKQYWDSGEAEDRDSLRGALTLETTKWQYTHGVRDVARVSPDTWNHVQPLLDRPGNQEVQLDLFYDYRTNVDLYPEWQAYFREWQPPMLIVWGANDAIFPAEGAYPYLRDLPDAELHLFETGHFLLEEDLEPAAELIRGFLYREVVLGQ